MNHPLYQKSQIAHSFSKAANTYDLAAHLQKQTGCSLLEKLKHHSLQPKQILDIGSGTGYFTQKIAQQYSGAQVTGVDLAAGMIDFANQNYTHENVTYLCSDADQLSCEHNKADVIFSNLMLQWSPNALNTLKTFKSLLKPGGHLFFSTLGDHTLFELRETWKAIDQSPHVHAFLSKEEIIFSLKEIGYEILLIEREKKCFYYPHLLDLFLNLKSLGAHNLQSTRAKGLSGRKTLSQLINLYEKFRTDDNQLPATYEVIYGIAK